MSKLPKSAPVIGTQILPGALVAGGIRSMLSDMRERVGINHVLVFCQNYTAYQYGMRDQRAAGKSPAPTEPLLWTRTEDRFYAGTSLRHPTAHRYRGDILDEAAEEARRLGIALHARILETFLLHDAQPGLEACRQIDAEGRPNDLLCLNHPDLEEWWLASAEECLSLHPGVAGFMFGQERGGPLTYLLLGEPPMCFCEHCQQRARDAGIRVEEARAGLRELQSLVAELRDQRDRGEGAFVRFWRILLHHPEALAWERLWYRCRNRVLARMRERLLRSAPGRTFGIHVVHGATWDPLYMAGTELGELARHADWIKPVLYSDCAAKRADGYRRVFMERGFLADLDPRTAETAFQLLRGLDPRQEPSSEEISAGRHAASAEYVARFTRRAVDAVAGRAKVYPGLGFDVADYARCEPDHVESIICAAFANGADGVFLPREYQEARPELLTRAGDTLRRLFGPTPEPV